MYIYDMICIREHLILSKQMQGNGVQHYRRGMWSTVTVIVYEIYPNHIQILLAGMMYMNYTFRDILCGHRLHYEWH